MQEKNAGGDDRNLADNGKDKRICAKITNSKRSI
jgi:hypothetical protein